MDNNLNPGDMTLNYKGIKVIPNYTEMQYSICGVFSLVLQSSHTSLFGHRDGLCATI